MTLEHFFKENPSVALGFSGGVDSSYLLYEGLRHKADIRAYYVKTAFQPRFELEDALKLAKFLKTEIKILEMDILNAECVIENPINRCYYCKKMIFGALHNQADKDNIKLLIDGTNASDDIDDRPGMIALTELSVRSPLREAGLSKKEIRRLSKEAGLFTWDKPAYACLATRIPFEKRITGDLLDKIEKAEDALFGFGFTDFRVRIIEESARLQFKTEQTDAVLNKKDDILKALKPFFPAVLLDLEGR